MRFSCHCLYGLLATVYWGLWEISSRGSGIFRRWIKVSWMHVVHRFRPPPPLHSSLWWSHLRLQHHHHCDHHDSSLWWRRWWLVTVWSSYVRPPVNDVSRPAARAIGLAGLPGSSWTWQQLDCLTTAGLPDSSWTAWQQLLCNSVTMYSGCSVQSLRVAALVYSHSV